MRFLRIASLPYPFGPRRGSAQEEDDRLTAPPIVPLMGRDDPASLDPNRPGPRSPLAGPVHPYLSRAMGLSIDERARRMMDDAPRIAPRVTLSITEQERTRGLRSVTTRLRTPPRTYDAGYNAAPFGRTGATAPRPLPVLE